MKVFISVSGSITMYRGEGAGSNSSVIEWLTPDRKLANEYAAGREGVVREIKLNLNNHRIVRMSHDAYLLTPSSFFSRAVDQLTEDEFDALDRKTALAARKKFTQHFGKGSREVMDYWTNERDKTAVRDLLVALGYDMIAVREGRNKTDTYGLLKK